MTSIDSFVDETILADGGAAASSVDAAATNGIYSRNSSTKLGTL